MIKFLLRKGADVDALDIDGWTPLHYACSGGHKAAAEILVIRGHSMINQGDFEGKTPLFWSCAKGRTEIVTILLAAKANFETPSHRGDTPLIIASNNGHAAAAKKLVDAGAKTDQRGPEGKTALFFACIHGHLEVVRLLLDFNGRRGVDRNLVDDRGITALHCAVRNEKEDIVRELCEDDQTDITIQDPQGGTPLKDAAGKGNLEIMLQLLSHQAHYPEDPIKDPTSLSTPFEIETVEKALLDCMDKLPSSQNAVEQAMYWAICNGREDVMLACMKYQEGLMSWKRAGATWLHLAVKYEQSALLPILLPPEGDLPGRIREICQDSDSEESPFSLAVKGSNQGIAQLFWSLFQDFGSSCHRFPDEAARVLELAAQFERPEGNVLLGLLQKRGLTRLAGETTKWSVLQWAIFRCEPMVVWWLLSRGWHRGDSEARNALQLAKRQLRGIDHSHTSEIKRLNIIISLLERNPPVIGNPISQDRPLTIPQAPEDDLLHMEGRVVEFYAKDTQIQYDNVARSLKDIIYTSGPARIIADVRSQDMRDRHAMKKALDDIDRAEGVLHKPEPEEKKSEPSEDKTYEGDTRNTPDKWDSADRSRGSSPGQTQLRWVHMPVNSLLLLRHLTTRLCRDSNVMERGHGRMMDFFEQSANELTAAGKRIYMKPQGLHKENTSREYPFSANKRYTALYIPYLCVAEKPDKTTGDEANSSLSKHEPVTLDQFYYTALGDTSARDDDQVLSKYLKKQIEENSGSPDIQKRTSDRKQILMVNQLWVWVIDEKTIISTTSNSPSQSENLIFDKISRIVQSSTIYRPESVESMLSMLMGITAGLFVERNVLEQLPSKTILDVFRESIQDKANEETKELKKFRTSLNKSSKSSKKLESANPYEDIGAQADLLHEIKDICDELNILKALTEVQETVWKQVFKTENLDRFALNHAQLQHTPTARRQEIEEMLVEAKMTLESVQNLLDLRQKQASILEAEYARIQAEDTGRQSNTVMVFTIITIIFAPLSFLTSLFALNVTNFPHDSGNVEYQGWWLFPVLFGSSIAFIIPACYIALNINDIRDSTGGVKDRWKGWWKRSRKAPSPSSSSKVISMPQIQIGQSPRSTSKEYKTETGQYILPK
ncbi:hypothetical protein BO71DRAFT_467058 [Aspergillus ellipticus CBS 707.79]|uniref:Uncharacterized protein n=1 Tax=Aspergillus ellipticus CBS 707.79 TaxID=1448320 RepID=A0A319DL46_9EURO|nr:hypothetical protein BO71DRAFT_467058 [Aspergillus ellipticus CBS 707.79]